MNKSLLRQVANRTLALLARILPGATTIRPALHRLRGCQIGTDVFIGDDCYLENAFPELISIGDHSALAPGVMIICHVGRTDKKKGSLSGHVQIGANVFVGARAFIAAGPDAIVRIGDGSCIGAMCCIVNRNIRPTALITSPAFVEVATCEIALTEALSYDQFVHGIRPLRPLKLKNRPGEPHDKDKPKLHPTTD